MRVIMGVFSLVLLVLISITSCTKKVVEQRSDCKQIIVQASNLVQEKNVIYIDSIYIVDHCLVMKLGFSGCDDDHEIDLVTDGKVLYSNPPMLRVSLRDKEEQFCQAFFTKEFSYNLEAIDSILGEETDIRLSFVGTDKLFFYEK